MTKVDLLNALRLYPDDMDVFLDNNCEGKFRYALANSVRIDVINFGEEPDSKPLAKEMVIIISTVGCVEECESYSSKDF